jgi:hypothetical protein
MLDKLKRRKKYFEMKSRNKGKKKKAYSWCVHAKE